MNDEKKINMAYFETRKQRTGMMPLDAMTLLENKAQLPTHAIDTTLATSIYIHQA